MNLDITINNYSSEITLTRGLGSYYNIITDINDKGIAVDSLVVKTPDWGAAVESSIIYTKTLDGENFKEVVLMGLTVGITKEGDLYKAFPIDLEGFCLFGMGQDIEGALFDLKENIYITFMTLEENYDNLAIKAQRDFDELKRYIVIERRSLEVEM
jgi:hypothetical protein